VAAVEGLRVKVKKAGIGDSGLGARESF